MEKVIVYKALDGRTFDNKEECEDYESTLVPYVEVKTGFDLTTYVDSKFVVINNKDFKCSTEEEMLLYAAWVCQQSFEKQYSVVDFGSEGKRVVKEYEIVNKVKYVPESLFLKNLMTNCINNQGF